jgi:hypothetical protein
LEHLISLIIIVIFFAIGVFIIYFFIDFFEYLKKCKKLKWREVTFERPFGISQENFYFYPIRPVSFISFMFSKDDVDDPTVTFHKKRIKFSILIILAMFLINALFRIFT